MNWFEEAQRSLAGCWLLVLQRLDGYQLFNETEAGFWRSFSAIFFVAPIYLWTSSIGSRIETETLDASQAFSISQPLLSVLVQWIAWPLAMALVVRLAGLARGFVRYIIVYNWSSVLVMAILVPAFLLRDAIGPAGGITSLLIWLAVFYTLYYSWFITRTAFETSGTIASALVLGNLVMGISLDMMVAKLIS